MSDECKEPKVQLADVSEEFLIEVIAEGGEIAGCSIFIANSKRW